MSDDAMLAFADREAICELLQSTAALLDEEKFDEWLALFDEHALYDLCTYSPEIRRSMSWWKCDRATLAMQIKEVPQHVRDPARRRHIVGFPVLKLDGERASAVSSFAVYRTTPEGRTSVFIVGRYEDALVKKSGRWLYVAHRAIADTRMLDSFTHLPI